MDSIERIKGGKTILLVTHHMALAERCDMIYRIDGTKLVRCRETTNLRIPGKGGYE